jgi:hypothetical protein
VGLLASLQFSLLLHSGGYRRRHHLPRIMALGSDIKHRAVLL